MLFVSFVDAFFYSLPFSANKRSSLLLVCVIAEIVVKLHARLHLGDDLLLRAVGEDVLVHVQRGLAHRAESGQRIQHQLDADTGQLFGGEQRRRAEFGDVRQHRHLHGAW